jgi:hypothetical protein
MPLIATQFALLPKIIKTNFFPPADPRTKVLCAAAGKNGKSLFEKFCFRAGLPDFSRYNILKQRKTYQITKNIPNLHEIYKMAVK